jgi:hypothetical protein
MKFADFKKIENPTMVDCVKEKGEKSEYNKKKE